MGYAVGNEFVNGIERHRGYGVPAWCDFPDCKEEIDRGLAYKCEEYVKYDDETGAEEIEEGCGLYFCEAHRVCGEVHWGITTLPDEHPDWIRHVLKDSSWKTWRKENPERVKRFKDMLTNVA